MAAKGDILVRLGAAVREQERAECAAETGERVVLTPEREAVLLDQVLARTGSSRSTRPARSRVLQLSVLAMAAAAIVLIVPWRVPETEVAALRDEAPVVDGSLGYVVELSGGSRGQTGAERVETYRSGQRILIKAVPEQPVTDAIGLRVSGVREGVVHSFAWPSHAVAAEKGIFRVEGAVDDLARIGAGTWLIRVELLRRGGGPAAVLSERPIAVEVR